MATAAGRGTKRLREESPESATSWEELLGVRRPQAQEGEEALAQTMAATAVRALICREKLYSAVSFSTRSGPSRGRGGRGGLEV